jgi:hypothetical protein
MYLCLEMWHTRIYSCGQGPSKAAPPFHTSLVVALREQLKLHVLARAAQCRNASRLHQRQSARSKVQGELSMCLNPGRILKCVKAPMYLVLHNP